VCCSSVACVAAAVACVAAAVACVAAAVASVAAYIYIYLLLMSAVEQTKLSKIQWLLQAKKCR
jgi:hypothetical protein